MNNKEYLEHLLTTWEKAYLKTCDGDSETFEGANIAMDNLINFLSFKTEEEKDHFLSIVETFKDTEDVKAEARRIFEKNNTYSEPITYSHINDCWKALATAKSFEELDNIIDSFPRWSGDWCYHENGTNVIEVTNEYFDNDSDSYKEDTREIELTEMVLDKDTKMKGLISAIYDTCEDFLNYVNGMGNQCAYTDRHIEEILDFAKELDKTYNNKEDE